MSSIGSAVGLQAVQQAAFQNSIAATVAAKQLDAYEQQGQAVTKLLEGAVQFSSEAGKGNLIDTHV